MSDATYDALACACGHQSFVGDDPLLLSLNNAITEDEFFDWLSTIPGRNPLLYLELKIDGMCVAVRYRNGVPNKAKSRKMAVPVEVLGLPELPGVDGWLVGEAWHPLGRDAAVAAIRRRDAGAGVQWTAFSACEADRQRLPDELLCQWWATCREPEQGIRLWNLWREGRIARGTPSDGLVVSVACPTTRERMGSSKRAPRYKLALK
jgi:hypothetical protein